LPWRQKKLEEHLTTEKNETNDSVTQDKNRSQDCQEIKQAAEEQCLEPSLEGDERWRRDDVSL